MALGDYLLHKNSASTGVVWDEKPVTAVSGKVLGFDSSLNPTMLDPFPGFLGLNGTYGTSAYAARGDHSHSNYVLNNGSASFLYTPSSLNVNLNNIDNLAGLVFSESTPTLNRPTGSSSSGSILQFADDGGNDVRTQFYHALDGSEIYTRIMWGIAEWKSWRKLWHDGNFTPSAIPAQSATTLITNLNAQKWNGINNYYSNGNYDGAPLGMAGFDSNGDGHRVSSLGVKTFLGLGDRAYDSTAYLPLNGGAMYNSTMVSKLNANHLGAVPLWAANSPISDFKDYAITAFIDASATGTVGNYKSGITVRGWTTGTNSWQLFGGASDVQSYNEWYLRDGFTSWGTANRIWHSGNNLKNYTDANADTIDRAIWSSNYCSSGIIGQVRVYSTIHTLSGFNALQFSTHNDWGDSDLVFRQYSNNGGAPLGVGWQYWRQIWHSGNFDPTTKAPASGSGSYIQNQTASAQSGDFWISGSASFGGNGSLCSIINHSSTGILSITNQHWPFGDNRIEFNIRKSNAGWITPLTLYAAGDASFFSNVNLSTAKGVFFGSEIYMTDNQINGGYSSNDDVRDVWINYLGYQNGNTKYRDFRIGNGRQGLLAYFKGSDNSSTFYGSIIVNGDLTAPEHYVSGVGHSIWFATTGGGYSNCIRTVNDYEMILTCGRGATSSLRLSNDGGAYFSGGVTATSGAFSAPVFISSSTAGLALIRPSTSTYTGISYQTVAGSEYWMVGMRENLTSNNYVVYNGSTGTDALTIATTGNATFSGSVTATGSFFKSLRSSKENIHVWKGNASNEVSKLIINSYNYNNDSNPFLGLIIDEVPDSISHFLVHENGESINTYSAISMALKAIQERIIEASLVRKDVDKLKKEMIEVKNENLLLKNQIKLLEGRLN